MTTYTEVPTLEELALRMAQQIQELTDLLHALGAEHDALRAEVDALKDDPKHPVLGDIDAAVWTVRDKDDRIVAEFRTEDEAINYGSMLANANPDDLYSVVVGRWTPSPDYIERTPLSSGNRFKP